MINLVVAECALRLRARQVEGRTHLLARSHLAHALAAAAGGSLQHHRIADLFRDLQRAVETLQTFFRTRHERHARLFHGLARPRLGAHHLHGVRAGTDELDARALAGCAQIAHSRRESRIRDGSPRPRCGARRPESSRYSDTTRWPAPDRCDKRGQPCARAAHWRSTSENTPIDSMSISRQARAMRTAISPRLAIRIRRNMFHPTPETAKSPLHQNSTKPVTR